MEIDFNLVRELTHALEMNGRQFILRDLKIQEMKANGTYDVKHNQDLIYFHIVSSNINSVLERIFWYFEHKNQSDILELSFRNLVISAYNDYKEFSSHCDFLSEMDRKYNLNALGYSH
ncbi:hypothetical protein [Yersinia phage fHe-Yen9-04]|uniref:Uncharacterized protein n=1 Tax=Yersinia phage fHe-Yen9-04 TaxID=2052742 RepID=A0A2C9CXX0_9CAUD|nr:hypothetical protein FDJ41_gp500 [Yersinia phage fHe-Yen9-04]SOK58680.1 hypothetical protein [Yersinia phage fHe-Yen9-04]VUE36449.1 hypothetical protein [Yersinia phage fHe-Yen9-04]